MSTESQAGSNTVAQPQADGSQLELRVDDQSASTMYSTTNRVWGSAEEIYIDFANGIQPSGENKAVLKVDQRVVVSPWSAKRLAIALTQVVNNYERMYGPLELDQRKRLINQPEGTEAGGSN